MNDLPSNLVPPNQRDLERVEQRDKFPAEPEEVDVDKEFKFFLYPFSKMEEKSLRVRPACKSPTFGKGIFLGFVPHTTRNCLWYNCETGNIGKTNHV